MPPSLELRTKQSLALTPRLQQSVRLLQLSSLEFQQELRNALDTNPFLEYDETQAEDNALSTDNGNSMGDAPAPGDQTRASRCTDGRREQRRHIGQQRLAVA